MIRDRLLGAWGLVSFESTLPSGKVISPLGRHPHGHIIYAPNGYVSVNLARRGRPVRKYALGFHALTDAAVSQVARAYMAYSGPFEIDEERALARHHFEICLDPFLIGTLQERHIRFIDGLLELSLRHASGVDYPSRLLWRRL